jgi:hypothetical protein
VPRADLPEAWEQLQSLEHPESLEAEIPALRAGQRPVWPESLPEVNSELEPREMLVATSFWI